MEQQGEILEKIAELYSEGLLKATTYKVFAGFTSNHFEQAHSLLKSGKSIGKIVIANDAL